MPAGLKTVATIPCMSKHNFKLKNVIQATLGYFGYSLSKNFYPDFEDDFRTMQPAVKTFTMTGVLNQYAMYKAVEYIEKNSIEGDIVECGVWKGGVMMLGALTLQQFGDTDRNLYLYDTYAGMSQPTEFDVNLTGWNASERWQQLKRGIGSDWCAASLSEVQENMETTGYPKDKIHYIKGKVEDTIPQNMAERIAILRLDTDFYESTKHELIHLFPRLTCGGVLIIDDYGHWKGSARAVDEYFKEKNIKVFLNRIDYTARLAIKIS